MTTRGLNLQRLLDSDDCLLNPSTWDRVDARAVFTEEDTTGALLLLKNYDILIYGWYEDGGEWLTSGFFQEKR